MRAHFRLLSLSLALLCVALTSRAQLTGTVTVPSTTYPDLNSVITALNTSGVGSGGCTVNVTAGNPQTAPTGGYKLGSATLNASLSAANPLVINGNGNTATGPTGTGSNDGIFWLLGTDYVTINALNLLDVSTTTTTTSTAGNEWGYMLGKLNTTAPYDGCRFVTINNCSISLNKYQSGNRGIYMGHANATSTSISTTSYGVNDANSYNKFTGNTISNVSYGFYMVGSSSSIANYDKGLEIGGNNAASGNTITLGGTALTNTLYGIYIANDSVIKVQYNQFSVSNAQTANATVYYFYPIGAIKGTADFNYNYMNVTVPNTSASVYCYYNASSAYISDAGATRNVIGNEITGSCPANISAYLYCIYDYNGQAMTLNINGNNIHDIDWKSNSTTNTSTTYIYGIYTGYNVGNVNAVVNVNNNTIYNIKRYCPGYTYLCYNYQYASTPGKALNIQNNVFRKITHAQTSGTGSNYLYPFYNYVYPASTTGTDMRINLQNNVLDSFDVSQVTSTYGYIYNYMNYYGGDSTQITGNQFTNWFGTTAAATYYTYFYNWAYGYYGPNGTRVSRNVMNNFKANLAYSYNYMGYYSQYYDSNVISNFDLGYNGGTIGYFMNYMGYYAGYYSTQHPFGYVRGNQIYNINLNNTTTGYYCYMGMYGNNVDLGNNSIRKVRANAGVTMYNYMGAYAYGLRCHDNWVDSFQTGTSTAYPFMIYTQSGVRDSVYNNRISNLSTVGTSSVIYPYYLACNYAGDEFRFYNNTLSDIEVPAAYNTALWGIYTTGTGKYTMYNNTIRINPSITPTGANYGATGVYFTNSGTVDFRNNIVNLNVVPGSNGVTVALRRSASSGVGISPANFLAPSTSNIYWVPSSATTSAWLYGEGTSTTLTNAYNLTNDPNFNTPCGLYKTFMGHEFSSFAEDKLTLSAIPGAYIPVSGSYAEKGATPTSIPAVTTDLAGATRGNPADIGALEFTGTLVDNAPPQINYSAVPPTSYCVTQPTITATITDQTGVDTTASNPAGSGNGRRPRLYYKKSTEANAFGANTSAFNGWKWVEANPGIVNNTYTFTFDYSKLFSAPVVGGNTIQYFIIAQDVTSNTNTVASIAAFTTCPGNVNLGSANAPVLTNPAPNQFTIVALPSAFNVDASYNSLCVSGSTQLTINPVPVGTNIQWQSATMTGTFSNITGATGNTYNTPVLTTSTRYRAVLTCGTTPLVNTVIDTIAVNNPSIVSVTPASRCGYGPLTLSANTGGTANVNWYATATSTNPIATGLNFTTPPLGSSVTYYATAVVPGGSTEKLGFTPNNYFPAINNSTTGTYGIQLRFSDTTNFFSTTVFPQGNGNVYIQLDDVNGNMVKSIGPLAVTGFAGNLTVPFKIQLNWLNLPPGDYYMYSVYNASTGTNVSLAYSYYLNAPTFTFPLLSNVTGRARVVGGYPSSFATSYYFYFYENIISGPCENPTRYPVTATVTPACPIVASSPNAPGICSGSSATLNVAPSSPTCNTYLYSWGTNQIPWTAATTSATGNSVTVSPTSNTKYYVYATDVLSGCTAIDSISLNVNAQQPAPVITPVNPTICEKSAVQLTASPSVPFNGQAVIGSGTLTMGGTSWPAPFGGYYEGNHEQYLVRASELTAAGMIAGSVVNSIDFFNLAKPGTPVTTNNFIMRMAHTTLTQMPAGNGLVTTGFTTVRTGASVIPPSATGWFTTTFDPGVTFTWDGVSNIIVDIATVYCTSCPTATCSSWTYYSGHQVQGTNLSFNATSSQQSIFNCTITSLTPSATNLYTTYATNPTWRPNMRFNWGKPYTLNWLNVTGLYKTYPPLAGPMTTADTNSKVWASPPATAVYRAVVNAQGCISNPSNPDTVFVNPAPPTTITPTGAQAICSGSGVLLTAPTGASMIYQWYLNGSPISGATSNTYNATAAGNYRVAITNLATGCADTSAVTPVTVNALPSATITAGGPTTFCNGGSVTLTASSTSSPVIYQWFRNGLSMGITTPTITVTSSGTYYVVVTNANQCTQQSSSVVVTVNTIPSTITPSSSTSFCTGGSVVLNAPTTGTGAPYTYQWFNGTSLIGGATGASYTATTAGNYSVTVTSASTGCGSSSSQVAVTIGAGPSSGVVPSGAQALCAGDTLVLTTNNAPGLSYQWYLNGNPISGATSATYAATAAGSYTVKVSLTSTPGCNTTTTAATVITINPKPVAGITTGGVTTFCSGGSVVLTAAATTSAGTITGYQWNVNAQPIPGATSSTYTASTTGNYTVTVTNSFGCSTTSAVQAVNVSTPPTIAASAGGPTMFCAGDSVTLTASASFPSMQWKLNGTNITGATGSTFKARATGVYTLFVTNASGCSNTSAPVSVQVNPLPVVVVSPAGPDTICSGTIRTLTTPAQANHTYAWFTPAGAISGATQNSYTVNSANSYSVRLTNTITGCAATSAPVVITVVPPPSASVTRTGAGTICSGDSVRYDANTGTGLTYQWNFNGTPIAGATGLSYWGKLQGAYSVTVKNSGGCTVTSATTSLVVNPSPAAFITYNSDLNFCEGSAVVLTANTGSSLSYVWNLNGAPTTNTGGNYIAAASGVYSVKVTNSFNCSNTSDTVRVTVYPTPKPSVVRSGSTLSTTQTYASYQWFFNNVAIGGATAQTLAFSQNGAYKVRVVDANGCEGWSELIFIMNVGITPSATSAAIKVFPNPTTGLLKIDAPVKVKLALRDVTGRVVAEASDVKEMDITAVANGTYILYISDMSGKLLRADKVTKAAN